MEFTALRLFGFAISAALQFFLLTFIRRNRKLEKLEILFLSLIACLFCWNFANFLLELFERTTSALSNVLLSFVVAPAAFGVLAFLPPLLLHIHLVFQLRVLPKPVIPVSRAARMGAVSSFDCVAGSHRRFPAKLPAVEIHLGDFKVFWPLRSLV